MKKFILLSFGCLGLCASTAPAQILYQQNFEAPVAPASTTVGPGGFVQVNNVGTSGWQIQGGGGGTNGVTLTAGVDNNGVGGSQGLFGLWDHSLATGFTFNQYTVYGAIAAPGLGTLPSQVQVSLQIFMNGSSTATPLSVIIQNGGNDLAFTPTLVNGAYTSVSFTLDQASNALLYNPLLSSNLRLNHGAGGFEFDAGNLVETDNILVQVVPEPAAATLLGLGLAGFLIRRTRS